MLKSDSPHRGRLIDVGPDGLGFIVTSEDPNIKLAFRFQDHFHSFDEAGLRDGDWVEFYVNAERRVETIVPLPRRTDT